MGCECLFVFSFLVLGSNSLPKKSQSPPFLFNLNSSAFSEPVTWGCRPLPGVSLSSHNWEQCDCLLITLIQTEICCFLPQIWVTDHFWMKLSDSSSAVADDKGIQGKEKVKAEVFFVCTGTWSRTLFLTPPFVMAKYPNHLKWNCRCSIMSKPLAIRDFSK